MNSTLLITYPYYNFFYQSLRNEKVQCCQMKDVQKQVMLFDLVVNPDPLIHFPVENFQKSHPFIQMFFSNSQFTFLFPMLYGFCQHESQSHRLNLISQWEQLVNLSSHFAPSRLVFRFLLILV